MADGAAIIAELEELKKVIEGCRAASSLLAEALTGAEQARKALRTQQQELARQRSAVQWRHPDAVALLTKMSERAERELRAVSAFCAHDKRPGRMGEPREGGT